MNFHGSIIIIYTVIKSSPYVPEAQFLLLFILLITLYHGMENINNHHHTPA